MDDLDIIIHCPSHYKALARHFRPFHFPFIPISIDECCIATKIIFEYGRFTAGSSTSKSSAHCIEFVKPQIPFPFQEELSTILSYATNGIHNNSPTLKAPIWSIRAFISFSFFLRLRFTYVADFRFESVRLPLLLQCCCCFDPNNEYVVRMHLFFFLLFAEHFLIRRDIVLKYLTFYVVLTGIWCA